METNLILFEEFFPTTELAIDLKLLTRKPRRLFLGETIPGAITRDDDDHYTFVEGMPLKRRYVVKRNPIVLPGKYVNVHRKADGTLYPTFNRPTYTEKFTFHDFCRKAAEELLAVAGFVGKEQTSAK